LPWSMCAMMQKFRISSGDVNVWSANELKVILSRKIGRVSPYGPIEARVLHTTRVHPC